MLSQRADIRERLDVMAQTYAYMTTKVAHGLGKEMAKSRVLFEDELSMQSSEDSIGLMRACQQMQLVANVKLGDLLQLDPVSPGNLLGDLHDMMHSYTLRCANRVARGESRTNSKTYAECVATDDIDFLCERTQLIELTHNHRVDVHSRALLVYLEHIRRQNCDALKALLRQPSTPSTRFRCIPLAHPDGGYFDNGKPYTAEQRTLLELYERFQQDPGGYQILVSTNKCRHYINAFLGVHAGYTFQLSPRFENLTWAPFAADRDEEYIKLGSLHVQKNMKIVFRSDYTEDQQSFESNLVYIVYDVIDVPWTALAAAAARHTKEAAGGSRPDASGGAPALVSRQPIVARLKQKSSRAAHTDFLSLLAWGDIQTFPRVGVSNEPVLAQHTRCVLLYKQNTHLDPRAIDSSSSSGAFKIARCSYTFHQRINLAFACTMHYMQGLSIRNAYIILERNAELHQKLANTAASRATTSVTVLSHESSTEEGAIQHFCTVVANKAPKRFTALWFILQDQWNISFATLDQVLHS
jgi:hypothetical protein